MSTISFGGLASGLDTDAIIKGLMEAERQPLERLEKTCTKRPGSRLSGPTTAI